jgi:diguanylate cyclase (GGDEF)-like protein
VLQQKLRSLFNVRVAERWRGAALACGLLATLAIAWLDHATPQQVSFALVYLIPVAAVTWLTRSIRYGMVLALACAVEESAVAVSAGSRSADPAVLIWNAGMQFVVLIAVVCLLAVASGIITDHDEAAIRDPLHGLDEARLLAICGQREAARSKRYDIPLTVASLELSGVDQLTDPAHHDAGDRLLVAAGDLLRRELREPDVVARMDDCRFAVLLAQCDQAAGLAAVERLRRSLAGLGKELGGDLRCRVGVATFSGPFPSFQAMLACATDLMHEAGSDEVCSSPRAATDLRAAD